MSQFAEPRGATGSPPAQSADPYFTRVLELADDSVKRYDPTRLKWMWGEALFTYSLHLLDKALGQDRYLDYICAYLDAHIRKGYRVDQSDTMAPGLTAFAAYQRTGDARYKVVVDRVVDYLLNSDRVLDFMPNHLGSSREGKFYPSSVWVDSVMMYGVFSGWYGGATGNTAIYDFASRQPALFAKYLQDPQEKLFYHCYWTRRQHTYPKRKVFWGRGNGWVIAGLPMAIEHFCSESREREEAIHILRETSLALLPYQREDGFYETVLNRPGKTYVENSATALIASGWMQGVAGGYLDERFLEPGLRAYRAVVDTLEMKDGLLSMPLISAPTIALPLVPYLGYKYTPRGNDWTYGLASLFFAGLSYKTLSEQTRLP